MPHRCRCVPAGFSILSRNSPNTPFWASRRQLSTFNQNSLQATWSLSRQCVIAPIRPILRAQENKRGFDQDGKSDQGESPCALCTAPQDDRHPCFGDLGTQGRRSSFTPRKTPCS